MLKRRQHPSCPPATDYQDLPSSASIHAHPPLHIRATPPSPCPQCSLGVLSPSLENDQSTLTGRPAALPLPGLCFGLASLPLLCLCLAPPPLPGPLLCGSPPRLLFAGLPVPVLCFGLASLPLPCLCVPPPPLPGLLCASPLRLL